MSNVYYVCNRKRCPKMGVPCSKECFHTSKLKYAKNFKKVKTNNGITYVENRLKDTEVILDFKFKPLEKLYFIVKDKLGIYSIFSTEKWVYSILADDKTKWKLIVIIIDPEFEKSNCKFNNEIDYVFNNEHDAVKYLLKLPHEDIFKGE